jgi:hypothetical protein
MLAFNLKKRAKLDSDRGKWRALDIMVMNLWVP